MERHRLNGSRPTEGGGRASQTAPQEFAALGVAAIFLIATAAAFGWWIYWSRPTADASTVPDHPVAGSIGVGHIQAAADALEAPVSPEAPQEFSALPAPDVLEPSPEPPKTAEIPESQTDVDTDPLVTAAAPAAPPPITAANPDVHSYLERFDGGSCFFATAMTVGARSATIEAFTSSVPAGEALDAAFQQAHGFEADIGLRLVKPTQCNAVDFVRTVNARSSAVPRIKLQSSTLSSAEPLAGTVTEHSGGALSLLLIDEEGEVYDVSDTLNNEPAPTFRIAWNGVRNSGDLFLLILIESDQRLQTLASPELGRADQLFPRLAGEVEDRQDVRAALKLVKAAQ